LVLDNASYNKAIRVREQAEASRIMLIFQPPYSPNLNLIERLWKFMRKKFCKDKYRSTFAQFRAQLDGFFAGLDEYRSELAALLTENFELLPSVWQAPALA
jgi:transposase